MSDEKVGMIHSAIMQIMSEIGAIEKSSKNESQGYKFRGIDAIYSALQPLLVKMQVYPTCRVMDMQREQRDSKGGGSLQHSILTLRYRLTCAVDNSYIETDVIGEGMDSGDKASNKALSVGYKYAILQLLCIPTEAIDPDSESPEPAAKGSQSPKNATFNDDRRPVTQPEQGAGYVRGINVAVAKKHLTGLKANPDDEKLLASFKKLKDAENGDGESAPDEIRELLMIYREAMDNCPTAGERSAVLLRKLSPPSGTPNYKDIMNELQAMWDKGLIGSVKYIQAKTAIEAAQKF